MNLRSKVLSGVYWLGGVRLLSQLFNWAITIVVIRLLDPVDYGLLAMAMVFMGLVSLIAEVGLGSALIRVPDLDESTLRRCFGAVILVDCALCFVQFAAAPLVAHYFKEERLIAVLQVLSLQFLLMIFTVIPEALLARKLDFKRASLLGLVGSASGGLAALFMAVSGYGVWALVFSNLCATLGYAVAVNVVTRCLPWPSFSLKGMRQLILIGGEITATRILYFFYSQADVFIAGRLLGKELLGLYSVSLQIASIPVQRVSSVVNTVAFPAFAEAQRNPASIPGHVLKSVRTLSFMAFPVMWGISSIATELVGVLLGPKWEAAALSLRLLPLVMPITMLSTFLNTAVQGIGHTRATLKNVLTMTVLMIAAFWIGAHWGLLGLSLAWVIGLPLVFVLNLTRVLPLAGVSFRDFGAALAPTIIASAGMYVMVTCVRHLAQGTISLPFMMTLLVPAGAVSYFALSWLVNRAGMLEIAELLRLQQLLSRFVGARR